MYKTKFYYLLKKATNDEKSLIIVIDKIMPLINKYSLKSNKKGIDEDLKSVLIYNIPIDVDTIKEGYPKLCT